MAALPIGYRDIITPYNVFSEEKTFLTTSANNRVYVARAGGYRYRVALNIRPFTLLKQSDSDQFELIRIHLAKYPFFSVPIFNTIVNEVSGTVLVDQAAPSGYNSVGDYDVKLTATPTGSFKPGQYIRFANKNKVYQVESHSGTDITLVQRLRQNLLVGDDELYYDELDYNGDSFNGVMGDFLNEDFGNAIAGVQDGVLGRINTLSLIENL